ncbi:MAG TPA: YcaO-like family protein, partial [Nitrososphaeraceae archaeon]
SSIPYNILENITDSVKNAENGGYPVNEIRYGDNFVDDPTIFPEVDISEIANEMNSIKKLVNRFNRSGISLTIKKITQHDIGIPTFVASSVEWISHEYGLFAKGYGTHNDARIALIRAITEMSQTRAVNIQGARDDLKKILYKENDEIYMRKWPFMAALQTTGQTKAVHKCKIKFDEIVTYNSNDILDDINLILNKLRQAGLKRIIIVDLTNPKLEIPVVRAIVPGLETFEVTQSIMGRRATEHFNKYILHQS